MPSKKLQYDKDTPVSFALGSMTELKNWSPNNTDIFNMATIPLATRYKDPQLPRLVLTHDMAGGYKEDRDIQGNDYDTIYYCEYWHFVDTFIYFSHKRVSIPPVNWINACHRNGVKCLGTFLVEGNTQMHEMEALLHGPPLETVDDPDPMRLWSPFYADKLVEITKHYGFDGWLFNVECGFFPFPTTPKYKAEELTKFLKYFRKRLHQEIPGSQVIWYDSMTIDGEIHWQNQLNYKNQPFFENTDGIFLNYWWKKEFPEMTRRAAERMGRSGLDVYFGTDVWGRHTYGGGGFKSYKGVKTASYAKTSSALFGMAWTYEHFEKQDFEKMDRLFWNGGSYAEYPPPSPKLETEEVENDDSEDEVLMHGHKKGIADTIVEFAVPGGDWFVTTFDRGFGARYYHKEKLLLDQPWSQLSHQAILPNLQYRQPILHSPDSNLTFECSLNSGDDEAAYIGGTCLTIQGRRSSYRESRDLNADVTIPLYKFHIDVSKGCTLRYIYKTLYEEDVILNMSCQFSLSGLSSIDTQSFFKTLQPTGLVDREEDDFQMTVINRETQDGICFCLPAMIHKTTQKDGWITKTVEIKPPAVDAVFTLTQLDMNATINTANLAGTSRHVLASLGYLSIIPIPQLATTTTKQEEEKEWIYNMRWDNDALLKPMQKQDGSEEIYQFWGTLRWISQEGGEEPWKQIDHYILSTEVDDIPNTRQFLGTSFCNQYRISGVSVAASTRPYIVIEAVNRLGDIFYSTKLDIVWGNI
ncbi:glycoside hydrolase family 85 protein [Backusella circina FSU 941]|nr:glycoside hydrolase family 85 protein [Backusella circina FSU 941]